LCVINMSVKAAITIEIIAYLGGGGGQCQLMNRQVCYQMIQRDRFT